MDARLKLPATVTISAPPPDPGVLPEGYCEVAPPEPHVVGANAEPYSAALQVEPPFEPQPACPPPPLLEPGGVHGPTPPANPPPVAVIVPATENDALLVNPTLPIAVIVDPAPSEKDDPTVTAPPESATAEEPKIASELRALRATPVASCTVADDVKTPSESCSANALGRVIDPPEVTSDSSAIVPPLLPSVRAVDVIVVVVAERVRFVIDANTPLHAKGIEPIVEMGGAHTVELAAITIDVICAVLSAGDVYEHRSGSGDSIVKPALVVDAVNTPVDSTVCTSLTPTATDPEALQL